MEPKKFLFISNIGLCVDFAWQVQKEGHAVKLYLEHEDDGIGDGFFEKVKNWKTEVDWADVAALCRALGTAENVWGTPDTMLCALPAEVLVA